VRVEPEEPSFDPARWRAGDAEALLARGIEEFNAGRWHDAHESFERVWLSTQGEDSDFYKGLIQAAICLHHLARGNLEGARGLYSGHRRHLGRYLPAHRGVDLAALVADMQRFVRPALAGPARPFDPSAAPRIRRTG
jgi:predicted metal-dependent hydrolase